MENQEGFLIEVENHECQKERSGSIGSIRKDKGMWVLDNTSKKFWLLD